MVRTERVPLHWIPFVFLGPVGRSAFFLALATGGIDPYGLGRRLGIADRALWHTTVYAVLGAIVASVLLRRAHQRGIPLSALGWRLPTSLAADPVALAGLLVVILAWLPVAGFAALVGLPMFWDAARTSFVGPHARLEFIGAAIIGVLLVPLVEEPLFRGLVYHALEPRWGTAAAVLAQALLFALYHVFVGPGMTLYILFWSLLPGLLVARWRSLWPCLLFHALNNIWADLLVPLLFRPT